MKWKIIELAFAPVFVGLRRANLAFVPVIVGAITKGRADFIRRSLPELNKNNEMENHQTRLRP